MSIKSKVIGVASDVMSAVPRLKALKAKSQADNDVSLLKTARAYDRAPDSADGGRAGMVRSLATDVRARVLKTKTK